MALSLLHQWTLVASGLVAHADHVLEGQECERLVAMVDQQLDAPQYAHWMSLMSDPDQLAALFDSLPLPPSDQHHEILESACWMAVVDGERSEVETQALERVAQRFGVTPAQLDQWHQIWSRAQHQYAELATAAAYYALNEGATALSASSQTKLEEFIRELPTTHTHRDALCAAPPSDRDCSAISEQLQLLGSASFHRLFSHLLEWSTGTTEIARERIQSLCPALDHPTGVPQ